MEEHTVINLNDDDGHLKKDVSKWTSEDVRKWLRQNGYKEVEVIQHRYLNLRAAFYFDNTNLLNLYNIMFIQV